MGHIQMSMLDTVTERLSLVNNRSGTYQMVSAVVSYGAMDVYEIRRARLRQLIDDRFRGVVKHCADALEMKPPQLHRWLSTTSKDSRRIEYDSARGIETKLALDVGWMDRLEDLSPSPNTAIQVVEAKSPVMDTAHPPATTLADADIVTVKVFDARASMGLGLSQPEHDTVVDHMRLTKGWVRTHLPAISGPENLVVLSAYGDSMAPTFADGDILLVDLGVQEIRIDAVYVLALHQELYIKRIQRRITDGAVIIKSDNPLYDPVVVKGGERDGLQVLGRVVWAWNGRKL